MNKPLLIGSFLIFIALGFVDPPNGMVALILLAVLAPLIFLIFRSQTDDKEFVANIFFAALAARILFGLLLHQFDLREFFGGDANTYDRLGTLIREYWSGKLAATDPQVLAATSTARPGWGMNYLVAILYSIFGRNILAAQTFCGIVGAATAPMIYFLAQTIFGNKRVARVSALSIALFPSFIIWSGQLLKDGLIVFLLVLTITMVLKAQEKFSYAAVFAIIFSLFGIISLRFYIFYMVAAAVAGSFIVGAGRTSISIVRRATALALIGIALSYIGVSRNAEKGIEVFGDLRKVQISRLDQAQSATSGFNEDADVSTTSGALSAVPLGLAYLMLAPFPWQMTNFRQLITLPEVLLWWAMMPLMVYGIWYTLKNRLRPALPILLFSGMLTLAYSIFQGNVGTAYRQRTQIQVFLFIFIAVGWTLWKERREDRELIRRSRLRAMNEQMRAGGHIEV
ncbi:MAG: Dolichyl-phosphate-mannose-protein mannosyltransferase [Acidobacteria bacterium OLB17]|nr:MAG: Dolichyl-phosphate-mannose-protein mannosyltransferase [Acidobacteria bacterium OLB17]MCZ2390300.1 glycosyltransferase family 39 protein [Acidobacteriota bacterium]